MSSTTSLFAERGLVLHVFLHPQLYLIGLVASTSFSFSLTFASLTKFNSGKDFGRTMEAVAFMDMMA